MNEPPNPQDDPDRDRDTDGEPAGLAARSRAGLRAAWRRGRDTAAEGPGEGETALIAAPQGRNLETPREDRPQRPVRPRAAGLKHGANENRRPAPSRAAAAAAAAALDAPLMPEDEEDDPLQRVIRIILRVVALVWLAASVWMWGRLIGAVDDTIDPSWHAPGGPWLTTLTAAVVYPVVAVGLWLRGRWGVVLWAAAVAAEVALMVLAPRLVPVGSIALAANLVSLAAVGGLALLRTVDSDA